MVEFEPRRCSAIDASLFPSANDTYVSYVVRTLIRSSKSAKPSFSYFTPRGSVAVNGR